LSPISTSAAAALVMQSCSSHFRLSHATLIFLHFYPGPASGIIRAPNGHHHQRQ